MTREEKSTKLVLHGRRSVHEIRNEVSLIHCSRINGSNEGKMSPLPTPSAFWIRSRRVPRRLRIGPERVEDLVSTF